MSSPQNIPVIFTFNILKPVYRQFQTQYFNSIKQLFEQNGVKAELLPIISYEKDTIETRAKQIKSSINEKLEQLKADKVHCVSFSASGLDARYFISELEGNKSILSLTTIATPNSGSFLASEYNSGRIGQILIEPVSRLVGMSTYSFSELNSENIQAFNNQSFNDLNIKYFSIGGERLPTHCSEVLKPTAQYIFDKKDSVSSNLRRKYKLDDGIPRDSDGIFAADEIQWGTHLINFEADHAELIGIGNKYFQHSKVIGLVSDNLNYNFQQVQQTNQNAQM